MFGRQVTLKLKPNSATELNRIAETEILPILRKQKGFRDETTFIAPERSEAIANSFWDTKANAEAYERHGVRGGVEDPFECDRREADGKDLRVRQFIVPPGRHFQVDIEHAGFPTAEGGQCTPSPRMN